MNLRSFKHSANPHSLTARNATENCARSTRPSGSSSKVLVSIKRIPRASQNLQAPYPKKQTAPKRAPALRQAPAQRARPRQNLLTKKFSRGAGVYPISVLPASSIPLLVRRADRAHLRSSLAKFRSSRHDSKSEFEAVENRFIGFFRQVTFNNQRSRTMHRGPREYFSIRTDFWIYRTKRFKIVKA